MKDVRKNLRNLTAYAISWFENLEAKYGAGRERRTVLTSFDRVKAREAAVANETLYINRKDGFVGWSLKKDEEVGPCSRLDDIIAFAKDGTMRVVPNAEKAFIGEDRRSCCASLQKDSPVVYNMIYRDGKDGALYAKRFQVTGFNPANLLTTPPRDPGAAGFTASPSTRMRPLLRLPGSGFTPRPRPAPGATWSSISTSARSPSKDATATATS